MLDTNTKLNVLLFGDPRIKVKCKTPDFDKALDEFTAVNESDWLYILENCVDEDGLRAIKIFLVNACTFIIDHFDELEFTEESSYAE